MKSGRQDYWFKRRRYGWGWTPTTWRGWTVVAVFLLFVLLGAFSIMDTPDGEFTFEVGLYLMFVAVMATLLVVISYKKGPSPKWRWGKKPDDDPDKDI